MTKNEFDILTFVMSNESDSVPIEMVLNNFYTSHHKHPIATAGLIKYLHNQGYLSCTGNIFEDARHILLNTDACIYVSPVGYHAMDEYKENTSRLDQAEKDSKSALRDSRIANIIAIGSLLATCGYLKTLIDSLIAQLWK